MKPLALVVDKDISYVNKKIGDVLALWGKDRRDVRVTEKWSNGMNKPDLFGSRPIINLDLSNSSSRKTFQDWYKKSSKDLGEDWLGDGIIISIAGGEPVTTVLERIVKENDGIVFKEKNDEKLKEDILAGLKIGQDEKRFLILYSGDDYSMLIPVINSLEVLPEEKQKAIDIEDLLSMLPQKPGANPPWEFSNYVFTGDLKEAMAKTKKALEHYHPILLFSFLQSSVSAMAKSYYARNILNTYKYKEQEKVLGIGKIKSFYSGFNASYGMNEKVLMHIADEIHKAENIYKGGGKVNPEDHFLALVYKITKAINASKK